MVTKRIGAGQKGDQAQRAKRDSDERVMLGGGERQFSSSWEGRKSPEFQENGSCTYIPQCRSTRSRRSKWQQPAAAVRMPKGEVRLPRKESSRAFYKTPEDREARISGVSEPPLHRPMPKCRCKMRTLSLVCANRFRSCRPKNLWQTTMFDPETFGRSTQENLATA